MNEKPENAMDEWLDLFDLDAIVEPSDKVAECKYFLRLAESEVNKDHFRWLISAFFGAAYSYFEITALQTYLSFYNPETGEPIASEVALEILRRYVGVQQNIKRPHYVKTSGQHEITKELYELRKGNTHHFPMSIMSAGKNLPEDFHFGNMSGKGVPALAFCRRALVLIDQVDSELRPHL